MKRMRDWLPVRWNGILRELVRGLAQGWIPGRAAQMSFYFFLSAFPSLLILVAVLSQFQDAQRVLRDTVVQHLAPLVPRSIINLVSDLLEHLAEQPAGLLTWGAAIALWAASSGMVVTIDGLNQAYAVTERRPWWKRRLTGLTLTFVMMLAMTVAMVLLALGLPLTEMLAQRLGLGAALLLVWRIAQWPAIFCFILAAFDLLYHFGPNRERAAWRWFPTETLIALPLWLAASLALKTYMIRFGNYGVLYGAVGGVIVLLLWLYLTAMAILVGAHIATYFRHPMRAGRDA